MLSDLKLGDQKVTFNHLAHCRFFLCPTESLRRISSQLNTVFFVACNRPWLQDSLRKVLTVFFFGGE